MQDCSKTNEHTSEVEYFLVQKDARHNISGFKCTVFKSAFTGYCGHYSATKLTDENHFHVPVSVLNDACMAAGKTGFLKYDKKEHKINLNRVTLLKYFTHGSVTYSSTNIACEGEKFRRSDGKVTDNMLRTVTLQVLVEEVNFGGVQRVSVGV